MIRRFFSKLKSASLDYLKQELAELRKVKPSELLREFVTDFGESILFPLYPVAVFLVLLYLMTTPTRAGIIRTVSISEDHPSVIHVARGRRTAIQFWTKPEKVVPGSPGKVQIDFLGDDIAVSPVAGDPGNLLVYTRNSRYVLLFQVSSEAGYDDVVRLVPGASRFSRAIRLDQDTYRAAQVKVLLSKPGSIQDSLITALVMDDDRRVQCNDLAPSIASLKHLQCGACVLVRKADDLSFYCTHATKKIDCQGPGGVRLTLQEKDR